MYWCDLGVDSVCVEGSWLRDFNLDLEWNVLCSSISFYVTGNIKTAFLAGSKFNASWHLGYPHKVSAEGAHYSPVKFRTAS